MDIPAILARLGTQAQAAKRLGVNARTLRRWATGESKPRGLSRKALEKAAKARA